MQATTSDARRRIPKDWFATYLKAGATPGTG
jgi:hypothetical protein